MKNWLSLIHISSAEGEVKNMNQIIFWLVLLVVLVVIEIATLGLTTIWSVSYTHLDVYKRQQVIML